MIRPPPISTLSPYTTPSRSRGGADLGARVEHPPQLVGEHRHRRVGVLDRERPAEPAALLSLGQLDQVDPADRRSEEHTSELQSRQYLVCRLLLEKKK